jgi:glycosyltransferase involved in cell wall biosynthesis
MFTDRLATAATMVWSRRAATATARVLDGFRPDVVHCHNLYHQLSPSVLRPVARRRIPAVMTVHDYKLVCPTYRLLDAAGQSCERCVGGSVVNVVRHRCQSGSRAQSAVLMVESGLHRRLGAYDPIGAFLCPSEYLTGLMARAGYGDRVRHLPLGCELSSVRARTGTGTGVVYGGRLSAEKGVDHLLAAVARTDDLTLTVCGDGPQRAQLEAQGRALLGDRVRFLGHIDRSALLGIIATASVVAVPSVWAENQPLMVIDALACGVPVVSGDAPALRELVRDGVSGIAVDARDHGALAAALQHFEHDLVAQAAIGRSARAFVAARHDMDTHLDALEGIYLQLLKDMNRTLGVPR